MRIVLLNQYYAPDGSATAQILSDLGGGLARRGNEVLAICCNRNYADPSSRYASRETIDGVRVLRTPTTGFGRGSSLGRVADYLSYLIGAAWLLVFRARPDVVVSLSTPPMIAALGIVLARVRRARSVYWVMDVYPELAFELGVLRADSLTGRMFRALARFTLRRSDCVAALGDTMAARLGSSAERAVDVVHTWADGEAIRPLGNDCNTLRREWGWSDRFVVLYSGNMGLAHEFSTVLDSAELLLDHPRIRFAFVGGGPRRAEVEAEVRRRGLDNVEFRPYVPRESLGQSLTAGDVHLVTLRERMPGLLVPSKIYGILAAGRPTIYVGPGEGEIHEVIRSAECGSVLEPGDAEGLAAALVAYESDPQRTRDEGARARVTFDRHYTLAHGLRAFERLLHSSPDYS